MVSKEFELSGKTALVAGDSRFWSKYVAAALAEAGADVAVAAKNSKKLEEAVGEVQRLVQPPPQELLQLTNRQRGGLWSAELSAVLCQKWAYHGQRVDKDQ